MYFFNLVLCAAQVVGRSVAVLLCVCLSLAAYADDQAGPGVITDERLAHRIALDARPAGRKREPLK